MATCTGFLRRSERLEEDAIGEIVVKSPTEVQWYVPSFFSLPEDGELTSSSFFFMDGEWCLTCSPNHPMCLGLLMVDSLSNPTIKFRLGIKIPDVFEVSQIEEHEFQYCGDAGETSLFVDVRTAYFEEEISRQGKLIFFCTFLSSCGESETYQDRQSKGAIQLLENIEGLFLNEDHHDIIINVKGTDFTAHKLILVVRCPFFSSMFSHDMIEKNTGVIKIEDCEPEVFREFLYFLYSGNLKNVSDENVIDLYVIADMYRVDEMKSECLEFMMRNISDENFCDFISLALRHSERELLNSATNYFVKNVKTIIVTIKWRSFHKEYPDESHELYIKAINHPIPP